jgi:hypothetical protein
VVDSSGRSILAVEADSMSLRKTIPAGKPRDVAVGLGAIWVADASGYLHKISEAHFDIVETYEVGEPVVSVAVDEDRGFVWLRSFQQHKID